MTNALLENALARLANQYPGAGAERQPVHTVYGGANLFKAGTARKLGDLALRSLDQYASEPTVLAEVLKIEQADAVLERVHHKLDTEPVEDQRVDFEDGYGNRPDAEEDEHARQAGRELGNGMQQNSLAPFTGIRIKAFTTEALPRATRTLDLCLGALAETSDGALPDNFVVTLPKVSIPEQIAALAELLDCHELEKNFQPGTLKLEFMVETTQAISGADGRCPLHEFVTAANGRCVAAHFGTYDYTAACDITAAHQTHDHPAADFARQTMQASLSGTGIRLSDGATTIMPIAPHKGADLSDQQQQENRSAVHHAWKVHFDNVSRSLQHGFYQSWDLNPAQLPMRYAAVYNFFLSGLDDATRRLTSFINKAAQANLVGTTFDDAATGQGLLNYFLRGLACGALTESEVLATGLSLDELKSRSFMQIVANRATATA